MAPNQQQKKKREATAKINSTKVSLTKNSRQNFSELQLKKIVFILFFLGSNSKSENIHCPCNDSQHITVQVCQLIHLVETIVANYILKDILHSILPRL